MSPSPSALCAQHYNKQSRNPFTLTRALPSHAPHALHPPHTHTDTGTLTLDTQDKDAALPILAGLQMLDMSSGQRMVEKWLADHLEPTDALRVRHMAESFHLADLAAEAITFVDHHFAEVPPT